MEVTHEELTAARRKNKCNALKDGDSRTMTEMESAAYGKAGEEETTECGTVSREVLVSQSDPCTSGAP